MCSKCTPKKKYWLHITDNWSNEEKYEMLGYLADKLGYNLE